MPAHAPRKEDAAPETAMSMAMRKAGMLPPGENGRRMLAEIMKEAWRKHPNSPSDRVTFVSESLLGDMTYCLMTDWQQNNTYTFQAIRWGLSQVQKAMQEEEAQRQAKEAQDRAAAERKSSLHLVKKQGRSGAEDGGAIQMPEPTSAAPPSPHPVQSATKSAEPITPPPAVPPNPPVKSDAQVNREEYAMMMGRRLLQEITVADGTPVIRCTVRAVKEDMDRRQKRIRTDNVHIMFMGNLCANLTSNIVIGEHWTGQLLAQVPELFASAQEKFRADAA